jgi:hypothetical protein
MSQKRKLIFWMAALALAILFQNCSKVQFQPSQGSNLVTKADSVDPSLGSNDPVVTDNQDGSSITDPDSSGISDPGVISSGDQASNDDSSNDDGSFEPGTHDGSNDGSNDGSSGDEDHPGQGNDHGGGNFICVLAGPGKSQHLGLEGDLLSKNATPLSVCMTAEACTQIVSQVFEVKGPEQRGFCPDKNPHVIPLSNEEIQVLVDKLK